MDYIIPSWGRGLYPIVFLTFFNLSLSTAQTVQQKSNITQTYDQDKLNKLIQNFERDLQLKKNSIASANIEKQWAVSTKQLDGTVVALNEIGTDGTLLFYTTHMDPTSKVSRADALYTDGVLDLGLSGKGLQVGFLKIRVFVKNGAPAHTF